MAGLLRSRLSQKQRPLRIPRVHQPLRKPQSFHGKFSVNFNLCERGEPIDSTQLPLVHANRLQQHARQLQQRPSLMQHLNHELSHTEWRCLSQELLDRLYRSSWKSCTRNGCSPGFQSATLTITSNAPQTYTLSYAYSGVHYPPSWQTQPSTITISSGQTSGTQLLSVKALTCTVQNCYTYINMTAMLGSTPVSSIILTLHSCGFGFCPQS